MKKSLFIIAAVALVFSCVSEPNSKGGGATGISAGTPPPVPAGTGNFNNPTWKETAQKISNGNYVADKDTMQASRMTYIVNKFWWIDGYVSSRPAVRADQRGKWYIFYPNRTFDYGKWDEFLARGTWRYKQSELNGEMVENLYTKTDDGKETRQWEMMMAATNEKMVWMGPPVGPNAGDQGMLQPYLQLPTEKDIFWQMPKVETRVEE